MLNYGSGLDSRFQALGDPTRRSIVARLAAGPASVKEIARPLPMSLPAVMQHIAVLENCGLVASDKRGRVRICRLEAAALAACERWLGERRAEWESRLDRLDAYLAELQTEEEKHEP